MLSIAELEALAANLESDSIERKESLASPDRIRSSVDFPEPEGPSSAMMVFGSTEKSTGAITWIWCPSGC